MHPRFRHVFTVLGGHSLGGAVATLCAYQLSSGCGLPRLLEDSSVGNMHSHCIRHYLHSCQDMSREVRCVTWGSPRVGDATFRQNYVLKVPSTARMINKWDPIPWVPCGQPADAGSSSSAELDDVCRGQQYMDRVVATLVERIGEAQRIVVGTGADYEHVVEEVQLEISIFERFDWLASKTVSAFTVLQGKKDLEGWLKAGGKACLDTLSDVLYPHLLEAYEKNLARAFVDSLTPQNIASEIIASFSSLREKLSEAGLLDKIEVDLPAAAETLASNSGLPEGMGQTILNGDLASYLSGANLAVNIVGHAGTWYGLYCINRKVNRLEASSEQRHTEVCKHLQHISMELQRLPERIVTDLRLEQLKDKVAELQSHAHVLAQNLVLKDYDISAAYIDNMRVNAEFLLRRVVDEVVSQEQLLAAPLACRALEAVCFAFVLELQTYKCRGAEDHFHGRHAQMWSDIQPRLDRMSQRVFWRLYEVQRLAPSCVQLTFGDPGMLEDIHKIDSPYVLIDMVTDFKEDIPEAVWNRLRAWVPSLPPTRPEPRDCLNTFRDQLEAVRA